MKPNKKSLCYTCKYSDQKIGCSDSSFEKIAKVINKMVVTIKCPKYEKSII
jgi:hypothetical protein